MDATGPGSLFRARSDTDGALHERRARGWWWPSWLTVLFALIAGAAAVLAIFGFQGRADEAGRGQLVLADMATEANRLSTLEWRAVAQRGLSAATSRELGEVRGRLEGRIQVFARVAGDPLQASAVRDRLGSYRAAVDEQLRLLGAGRFEAAELVDEKRVDPSFQRLEAELTRIRMDENQVAESASRMAAVGTVASLAVAGACLLLMFGAVRRSSVTKARERQLEHDASHDFLTGLPNRRKLTSDLARELAAGDQTRPGLLVMFDLDGFKAYNDSFGHPEGDLLLRRLSAKLGAALGALGTAYRLGGDEFCAFARTEDANPDAIVPTASRRSPRTVKAFGSEPPTGMSCFPRRPTTRSPRCSWPINACINKRMAGRLRRSSKRAICSCVSFPSVTRSCINM